jgi:hypothetical protein
MIGLLSIKFLELKSHRDFLLIVFVTYFLVLGALLFSQSIVTCFYLLSVIVVVTAALLKLHYGEVTGDESDEKTMTEVWRLLRISGKLVLQALPLTILLFLFFPRIQTTIGLQMNQAKIGRMMRLLFGWSFPTAIRRIRPRCIGGRLSCGILMGNNGRAEMVAMPRCAWNIWKRPEQGQGVTFDNGFR